MEQKPPILALLCLNFNVVIVMNKKRTNYSRSLSSPFQILSLRRAVDPSHGWQSSTLLQRTGSGLLSVLCPRLASIQGLHLHQSDTKPHGPPVVSPQEKLTVTDLCYL